MEAGVAFKLSDRVWPEYNKEELFPKPKWNGRNDTIKLPYATIASGSQCSNYFKHDVSGDVAEKFQISNKCLATLSSIKTEYARKGFHYMWAKLYNDLPIDVRTAENKKDFKEKFDLFLK